MSHEETKRLESLVRLRSEKKSFEARRLSYREETTETNRMHEGEEESRVELSRRLGSVKEQIEVLEQQISEKKSKLQENQSRVGLLGELLETSEEMERKLLATLSGSRLQGKLVKSLREILRVQSGYETAVEAVLGAFAQALVAEDVETAMGLVKEMTDSHAGPCGIFIQSLVQPNGKPAKKVCLSHPKVQCPLEEVVRIQEGFETLFSPLFENVFVVEDCSPLQLGELLPLAKDVKLVTPQGILLGPEARIFFRNGRLSPDQGPFRRQAEMQALKSSEEALTKDIETTFAQRNELTRELQSLEESHEAFENKTRDRLVRKEAMESLLLGVEERLLSIEQEIRVLESEQGDAQAETLLLKNQLQGLASQIRDLEKEGERLSLQQSETDGLLSLMQSERENRIHALSRLKTLLENHEKQQQTVESSRLVLQNQIQNTKERLARLGEEESELRGRVETVTQENQELDKKREKIEEDQQIADQDLAEVRGCKAFQAEKHKEVLLHLRQIEDQLKQVQQDLHEREMKLMELAYREKNIFDRMEQTYQIKLAELREEPNTQEAAKLPADEALLDEAIQSLKSKVEAFGPVNLLAVEEYEELKQRYDFLATQEKDLNQARESLLEAIRKINRTTKTLFADTFTKAQTLFQEYYQTLFGGGHAELTLVQNEGEEEEGVDIMVRPPGKKLQHISLLSGGEKALTAVALLFALFRIRPSPLCVLDEVDAPLDEANVDRFLTVLRTFLDATQFLIVTHNRKTIAMGDFLYGITMEESGVSKLVSVKVGQEAQKKKEDVVQAA